MIAVVPTTAIAFLTIREITNLSFLSIWIRIELVHCPIGAYISRIVNHLPNGVMSIGFLDTESGVFLDTGSMVFLDTLLVAHGCSLRFGRGLDNFGFIRGG